MQGRPELVTRPCHDLVSGRIAQTHGDDFCECSALSSLPSPQTVSKASNKPRRMSIFRSSQNSAEAAEGQGPFTLLSRKPCKIAGYHDFRIQRHHALRRKATLRRCFGHLYVWPALWPYRAQRRRQIHIHEDPYRRARCPERHSRPSKETRRPEAGPVRV